MANPTQNLTCLIFLVLVVIGTSCTGGRVPSERLPVDRVKDRGSDPVTKDTSPDKVWSRVENKLVNPEQSIIDGKPLSFAAFKIDIDKLNQLLALAKLSSTTSAHNPQDVQNAQTTVVTLPKPDGSFPGFEITEAPIMEPALAERFPQLKAYKARGVEDRTATGRLELTPEGLHGMVISSSGTFFVDVANNDDKTLYISYFSTDSPPDRFAAPCLFEGRTNSGCPPSPNQPQDDPADNNLRTYRLAVAAPFRYVMAVHQFINPNGSQDDLVTDALTAIHRTINRVNLIFETDLGISFVLVADETKIIYANEALDPYAKTTDHDELLEINQANLDATIKIPNYDVGHLFTTLRGGGGAQPSACGCYKGWGVSGRERPLGNAFDVNLVSHELGHQFGASHSFNGSTLGCKYRNECTAYEPGSGSTIMGYASDRNICGSETIQALADPYFHAKSLEEIRAFIREGEQGDSCATKTATTNLNSPRLVAPANLVIPRRTPFTLTVSSGTDDDGDVVVYSWEQFELGHPDPPNQFDPFDYRKIRPIFRSYPWTNNPSRTFPALDHILNPPEIYIAESLPLVNRTMRFRVTGRDTRGRFGFTDVNVRVIARRGFFSVGPFQVTHPQAGAVWQKGSTQTVTWDVANTDREPISCRNVRISLLTEADPANPIVLLNSTPNNGQARIRIPDSVPVMRKAWIKVEAVDNIFFNVSPSIEITN